MGRGVQGRSWRVATVMAATLFVVGPAQASSITDIVFSNVDAPTGDLVSSNMPIGTSGWFYTRMQDGGEIGINPTFPWPEGGGNASVFMRTPGGNGGGGGTDARAFIGFISETPIATLGDLEEMRYAWYRDSASMAETWLQPDLRVLVGVSVMGVTLPAALVYELAYDDCTPGAVGVIAATDTWVEKTVDATTCLYSAGALPEDPLGKGAFNTTLADWQAFLPETTPVFGFSSQVGTGWSFFEGAVDGIGWTFSGQDPVRTDFEMRTAVDPIPLPAAGWLLLGGLGVFGAMAARRRRAA